MTDLSIHIIHQQKLRNLNELDLSLTSITDKSSLLLSDLILHGNLRKLDISATGITNKGIQTIASTGRLNLSMLYLRPNMSAIPNQLDNMSSALNGLHTKNNLDTDDIGLLYSKTAKSQIPHGDTKDSNTIENNVITHNTATKSLPGIKSKTNPKNINLQNQNQNDKFEYRCYLGELRIRHMKSLSIRSLEMLSINARGLKILDISHSRENENQLDGIEYVNISSQPIVSSSFWDRVMLEFRRNGTLVVNEI